MSLFQIVAAEAERRETKKARALSGRGLEVGDEALMGRFMHPSPARRVAPPLR